ncbi:MAG TPA: GIY-YIG nuclease family protein [Acidobacteriaceae bacterium]|nr:GIY-YIG nuclease family protein [Acidobacteriaceae bacterium]
MHERRYSTYIVASRTHVIYIGVTNDIERRMREHKNDEFDSFTSKYKCNRLVWLEQYNSPSAAIARETQLKGWRRSRKIDLIERSNPTWIDLSEEWGRTFLKQTGNP